MTTDLPPVAMFFSSDGLSTDGGSFSGGGSTNVDGDIQQKYIYLHMCMHACMFFKRPQVSVIEVVIVGQTNHFLGAVPTSRAIMLPVALAHAVLPAHTISVEFKSPLRTYS
jgi:hypothetical protein